MAQKALIKSAEQLSYWPRYTIVHRVRICIRFRLQRLNIIDTTELAVVNVSNHAQDLTKDIVSCDAHVARLHQIQISAVRAVATSDMCLLCSFEAQSFKLGSNRVFRRVKILGSVAAVACMKENWNLAIVGLSGEKTSFTSMHERMTACLQAIFEAFLDHEISNPDQGQCWTR